MSNYESWRISYQSSESAAQAAWKEMIRLHHRVNELESAIKKQIERGNDLSWYMHDQITAQQAAWIEWQHGKGAEKAMSWIHNGLVGPGHIPDGTNAQEWFDANCSDALRKPVAALAATPAAAPVVLPEPDFRLKWHNGDARYTVNKPDIGDTDCYTADTVRTLLAGVSAPAAQAEPVAWLYTHKLGGVQAFTTEPPPGLKAQCQPLYTSPHAQADARATLVAHHACKPDMLINGGALKLALNVLRRAGKNEVADELEATAVPQSLAGVSAPAAPQAQDSESVLIEGTAYEIPAPVAAELLRLHIELQQPPADSDILTMADALIMQRAADARDAARYRWLRSRDLETIGQGGVFAGMTPENVILNGVDLDEAVDTALADQAKQGGKA